MKSLTLVVLVLGVVFITMGYMEIYLSSMKKEKVVEEVKSNGVVESEDKAREAIENLKLQLEEHLDYLLLEGLLTKN